MNHVLWICITLYYIIHHNYAWNLEWVLADCSDANPWTINKHFDGNRNSPQAEPATPLSSQLGYFNDSCRCKMACSILSSSILSLTLVLHNPQPVDGHPNWQCWEASLDVLDFLMSMRYNKGVPFIYRFFAFYQWKSLRYIMIHIIYIYKCLIMIFCKSIYIYKYIYIYT